jgi:hypothetical protein
VNSNATIGSRQSWSVKAATTRDSTRADRRGEGSGEGRGEVAGRQLVPFGNPGADHDDKDRIVAEVLYDGTPVRDVHRGWKAPGRHLSTGCPPTVYGISAVARPGQLLGQSSTVNLNPILGDHSVLDVIDNGADLPHHSAG